MAMASLIRNGNSPRLFGLPPAEAQNPQMAARALRGVLPNQLGRDCLALCRGMRNGKPPGANAWSRQLGVIGHGLATFRTPGGPAGWRVALEAHDALVTIANTYPPEDWQALLRAFERRDTAPDETDPPFSPTIDETNPAPLEHVPAYGRVYRRFRDLLEGGKGPLLPEVLATSTSGSISVAPPDLPIKTIMEGIRQAHAAEESKAPWRARGILLGMAREIPHPDLQKALIDLVAEIPLEISLAQWEAAYLEGSLLVAGFARPQEFRLALIERRLFGAPITHLTDLIKEMGSLLPVLPGKNPLPGSTGSAAGNGPLWAGLASTYFLIPSEGDAIKCRKAAQLAKTIADPAVRFLIRPILLYRARIDSPETERELHTAFERVRQGINLLSEGLRRTATAHFLTLRKKWTHGESWKTPLGNLKSVAQSDSADTLVQDIRSLGNLLTGLGA